MDVTVEYGGKQIKFCDINQNDYIEGVLQRGGWYEIRNLEFIRDLNVTGAYIDAGAYIGTHSLFFSLFCPSTEVYSFEPQSKIYQKLVNNIAANNINNCKTFNVGLSNYIGTGLLVEAGETNKGTSIIIPTSGDTSIITLDCLHLKDIKLMKVDVECMEFLVLSGAIETLKTIDHLFVEMWHEETCKRYQCEYTYPKVSKLLEDS
jgi:protein O-GlcNAc transferase